MKNMNIDDRVQVVEDLASKALNDILTLTENKVRASKGSPADVVGIMMSMLNNLPMIARDYNLGSTSGGNEEALKNNFAAAVIKIMENSISELRKDLIE